MTSIKGYKEFESSINILDHSEFDRFAIDLMYGTGKFSKIEHHQGTNGLKYDIKAYEENGELHNQQEWFTDIKRSKMIDVDFMHHYLEKLNLAREVYPNIKCLLITSGQVSSIATSLANNNGIEIWDRNKLYNLFQRYTPNLLDYEFDSQTIQSGKETYIFNKYEAFVSSLNSIQPGKDDWMKYQQLISDILEYLFCPPLESPHFESPDTNKRNRRDMIFENSSVDDFWTNIRETYKGHYVVVDAKNYVNPIGKRSIIEIAHYLKPFGCGMFGLIASRKGLSGPGISARRDQWIGNNKLIIVISDEDIIEMLKMKKIKGKPEEIIRNRIATFRMSL